MKRIGSIATADVVVAAHDDTMVQCRELMAARGVRHLPVVRDGKVVGLLADSDVDRASEGRTADDVAPPVPVMVSSESLIHTALETMISMQAEAVLVVDDGVLRGIVTEHDVVRLAAETLGPEPVVSEVCSSPIQAVGSGQPATMAYERMLAHNLRHILVMDGDALTGVMSYRDLVEQGVQRGSDLTVGDLCHRHVHTATPDMPVLVAAGCMVKQKIGCLPVLSGREPYAVLSRRDVAKVLVRRLQARI